MSGLSMKFGGSDNQSTHSTDFSHLENNPKYKPEDTESAGNEPEDTESAGNEPEDTESAGNENINNGDDAADNTAASDLTNTPADNTAGQSSLNTNTPEQSQDQQSLEVTEEMLFKNLSEKLGREITSLDDLKPEPINIDPQIKAINDWKEKTGRPIEDFFKFQKDFTQVNDIDVAREFLQIEYPTLTDEEIALELEQFVSTEDDLDSEAAKKNLALKKYATKGRQVLETMKAELGEPSENMYTPEVKQQLEFAKQIQEQIKANQGQQKAYMEGISGAALSKESMKLNLSDNLSIDFKISEEDRKSIPSFINEMPHWKTESGEWNHNAVVEDSIKIKNFDAMIKLAYEQGLNSGKDDVIKSAKNSTLGNTQSMAGQQGQGQKKPIIEGGVDKLLGGKGMTMRF